MKPKDWISLIEAGNPLDGNVEVWLKNVFDQASPLFDRGWWPGMWTYRHVSPLCVQCLFLIKVAGKRAHYHATDRMLLDLFFLISLQCSCLG